MGWIALTIPDAWAVPIGLACLGGVASWVLWVTVSTFRNNDERERQPGFTRRPSRRDWRRTERDQEER